MWKWYNGLPLNDEEVVKIVEDNIARSIGYYDSH